ncbi:MAG: ribosome maturation factor RimM, partial [Actinomycetota bacterium]
MTDSGPSVIPVGYVRKAHGIRGDVVVRGLVDDAVDRLVPAASFDTNEDPPRTLTIEFVDSSGTDLRIHFASIEDRNAAETLKGVQLVMDVTDRRELGAGEWWPEDLVGCSAVDISGTTVGEVVEVIVAGAQDRLVVVRPDGASAEIPFVEALVPMVDTE